MCGVHFERFSRSCVVDYLDGEETTAPRNKTLAPFQMACGLLPDGDARARSVPSRLVLVCANPRKIKVPLELYKECTPYSQPLIMSMCPL